MPESIGVGIVGLSATGGWAATAHVPALAAVPGYELRALSASSKESARAAGEKFAVPHMFTSAAELAACDEVDLVVVTVQAARHRDLVLPALAAGKSVYCEWPLAVNEPEAAEFVAAAQANGIRRTAVGLQARSSPVMRYMRDLVAEGWTGEVLSTSVVASGMAWGAEFASRTAILLDNARRYNRERATALTLQRSLLPTGLSAPPSVEVTHHYLPGNQLIEVGGDWYESIALPGARVALVVGDVAGHGVRAAVTMGRLRTAIQTLAMLELPPAESLQQLN